MVNRAVTPVASLPADTADSSVLRNPWYLASPGPSALKSIACFVKAMSLKCRPQFFARTSLSVSKSIARLVQTKRRLIKDACNAQPMLAFILAVANCITRMPRTALSTFTPFPGDYVIRKSRVSIRVAGKTFPTSNPNLSALNVSFAARQATSTKPQYAELSGFANNNNWTLLSSMSL